MKLRRRRSSDKVNYVYNDSEDFDSSDSEPDASSDEEVFVPRQQKPAKAPPRKRKQQQRQRALPVKVPELLETALQLSEMRRFFDENSLKALRLTSKKIRKLVEDSGALTHFHFSGRGHKDFNEYLKSPISIQRVEAITLHGKLSIPQAMRFVLRAPPKLKSLALEKTSEATEVILSGGSFPQLTSLTLEKCPAGGESWNLLSETAWPLEELNLSDLAFRTDSLPAILANFPQLKFLRLDEIRYLGSNSNKTIEQGLDKLEVLEISRIYSDKTNHYFRQRLFHENLQLPSLHTLVYRLHCFNPDYVSLNTFITHCSWIKQLRSLNLNSPNFIPSETFLPLMSCLRGGPLRELTLRRCNISKQDWFQVYLPNLVYLSTDNFITEDNLDYFAWFSTANLPVLEKAHLDISTRAYRENRVIPSDGIDHFVKSYPHLNSLRFSWDTGIQISLLVVNEFFKKVVPQLDKLTITLGRVKREEDFSTFLETEDKETKMKWPKLKKLELRGCEVPAAVVERLASDAHRFPQLSHLSFTLAYMTENREEVLDKFAATLVESNAWPLMSHFDCNLGFGRVYRASLRKLWPKATMIFY